MGLLIFTAIMYSIILVSLTTSVDLLEAEATVQDLLK